MWVAYGDCYSYSDPLIDSLKQWKYLSSLPGRGVWTDSVKKTWAHVPTETCAKVELTGIPIVDCYGMFVCCNSNIFPIPVATTASRCIC